MAVTKLRHNRNRFTDYLIDGQPIVQSGIFKPDRFLISRQYPNRLSPRIEIYPAHHAITYQGKIKSDGQYWLVLESGYLCVATNQRLLYGHDSDPNWGFKNKPSEKQKSSTGSRHSDNHFNLRQFVAAEPLVFRTSPEWTALSNRALLYTGDQIVYNNILSNQGIAYIQTEQGFLPYYNQQTGKRYGVLAGSDLSSQLIIQSKKTAFFKMNGRFCFNRRAVNIYQTPDLNSPILGHLKRDSIIDYTGKLADKHRGWLQLTHAGRHSYVPFMSRYPIHDHYFGKEITGSKSVSRLREPWTFDQVKTLPDQSPTHLEKQQLQRITSQLKQLQQPDSVVIGLINDTHYDAHQSSATQRPLRDLKMISQLAREQFFDGLVMNGDLVDGNQPLNRTIVDTGDAISVLKNSHRPVFITQGNHDDNSGFARYLNGYRTEQVVTEQTALNLRNSLNNSWLANQHNFYGKYHVPGTPVSLIMLNTFDIRDSSSDVYFDRDYDDQPNGIHWTGILQNIRHSRSRIAEQQAAWLIHTLDQLTPDEQVIIFSHDSIRSATDKQAVKPFWTYDWFANNQQGDYARVYSSLVKHRQQIIAVMSGHTHVDDWSNQDGINWIATTSDIADRRKTNRLDNPAIGAWDVLIINPKQRQLFRLRYGWHDRAGKLRNWQYRLFGDGTDTKHRSLKTILKRQDAKPLTGNALYYQNQNKQVDQVWRGFRGYFEY